MPVRRTQKPSADRILEAAEEVFAEHGYGEVSLRQLMAAAGVSTTAFYARFDSKEAVMAALTARLFGELYAAAPGVLDRARDLDSGIEVGVDLLCERFAPRKALVKLVLGETGSIREAVEARRRAYGLLAGFLAGRFATLVERKRIVVEDPDALAWALVGALEIQFTRWALWDDIDLPTLRVQLRAAARAILPAETRSR
ncbi:MAG: TetR/AcrR family transcriptional regulator [Deltaproteobacteria bacterium]|nr:TetR/AcrR family transcriptional regulator [Deltaproteobacteria bacterium]MDQ3296843.1 TetR/AcrR family transcriptional regulator [Myxococcota bacterium]